MYLNYLLSAGLRYADANDFKGLKVVASSGSIEKKVKSKKFINSNYHDQKIREALSTKYGTTGQLF